MRAVLLVAHGSKSPQWSVPLESLRARVDAALSTPVRIAYLELQGPRLEEAVAALADEGHRAITVVPVFLGTGRHLQEDLPRRLEAIGTQHEVDLALTPPIGEVAEVLDALARAIAELAVTT